MSIFDRLKGFDFNSELLKASPLSMSVRWKPEEVRYAVWGYVLYKNKEVQEVTGEQSWTSEALQHEGASTTPRGEHVEGMKSSFPQAVESIFICLRTVTPVTKIHSVAFDQVGLFTSQARIMFRLEPNPRGTHIVLAVIHNTRDSLTTEVINRQFPTKPLLNRDGTLSV